MTRDMRPTVSRHLAFRYAAVLILIFLVPQRAAVQESNSPNPKESCNLETSVNGPLQQKLEAEFPDSFREGVDIFWESREGWVSPEVFDWWAFRVKPEGLTREAAERMFSRIPGRSPVFSSPRRRQICAVVGASRNLLGSRYGPLIDSHDVVIRVNRAPTEDLDSDVGKRTTHHVMWPRELEESEFNREAYLLMTPISASTVGVFDRILTLVEDDLRWDLEDVRIIHPEFVKYIHENWTREQLAYPSTGFIALMVAVHVCDEVDVFGFGADAAGRWDRYYDGWLVDAAEFHPADLEGQLRREMEEKGILKVFRGNRPDPSSRTDAPPRD
jgi:beta-galactoside alpha-2,3-sialyltransferase (sialyltransferase 4A)